MDYWGVNYLVHVPDTPLIAYARAFYVAFADKFFRAVLIAVHPSRTVFSNACIEMLRVASIPLSVTNSPRAASDNSRSLMNQSDMHTVSHGTLAETSYLFIGCFFLLVVGTELMVFESISESCKSSCHVAITLF